MHLTIRSGTFALAASWLYVGTVAGDQRIPFNIFNENCQTRFNANDIAVDDYGTIYLVDELAGLVERFNYNGVHAGFLVRGEPANPELEASAVALDPSGTGYVASHDDAIYRIPRYPDAHVTPFMTLAGDEADDLAVDAGGTIHAVVADQILRIGPAGNVIARFDLPDGPFGSVVVDEIDVDSGRNLYAADRRHTRVLVLDTDGQLRSFSAAAELPAIEGIAVRATPIAEEILVGVDDNRDPRVARFTPSGTFLGSIHISGAPRDIEVDSYGSIYVLAGPGHIHGIDPDITSEQLFTAARAVALPGLELDGSPQGEYFKGLAVRAGRTYDNFVAVTEAVGQLEAMRAEAEYTEYVRENPRLADRISRSTEEVNGFLTAVQNFSPIEIGEDCDPALAPDPTDPIDELAGAVTHLAGGEPFYGRYRSSTPIGLPLPPHIEMTLDTSTATSSFIKPGTWGGDSAVGGGLVRPEVLSSHIAIDIDPGGATVSEFSSEFGSIDINGTPSGINRAALAPNGQVFSTFGPGPFFGLEFEAHAEGIITNDLYPASRPVFTFADLEGYQGRDGSSAAVYGTNEPMIVPGPPSGPPTDLPGIAFIATRASFDPADGRLRFQENTDPSDSPDVSVILTPDGVFAGGVGSGEPVAGATFDLEPLMFTGFNATSGRFEFEDSSFEIVAGGTTLASGQFTDIGVDPERYLFTASLALDDLPPGVDSPFLDALATNLPQVLLLMPNAALDLLRGSDNFNSAYQTPTRLMVLAALVPEPRSIVLLLMFWIFRFAASRVRFC
jgi:hypothetical protein